MNFKHPDLPPHKRPIPHHKVKFNQLVHVFGKRPQGDWLFFERSALLKIRFPEVSGIDFFPLPDQFIKEPVVACQPIQKISFVQNLCGIVSLLYVFILYGPAEVSLGTVGGVLQRLNGDPRIAFSKRGNPVKGIFTPCSGMQGKLGPPPQDVGQVALGIMVELNLLRVQP